MRHPLALGVLAFVFATFSFLASNHVATHFVGQPHFLWMPGVLEAPCVIALLLAGWGLVRSVWQYPPESLPWSIRIGAVLCLASGLFALWMLVVRSPDLLPARPRADSSQDDGLVRVNSRNV